MGLLVTALVMTLAKVSPKTSKEMASKNPVMADAQAPAMARLSMVLLSSLGVASIRGEGKKRGIKVSHTFCHT